MIAIIDYDMGNLKSVSKAFTQIGANACVTRDPKKIKEAQKIVLPGVGAFSKCMENLANYGLIEFLKDEIKRGKKFLGICLGFQLLFDESEEFGPSKGLGILPGKVKRFQGKVKVPHIGWNQIRQKKKSILFKEISDESFFYFVHSYYVVPQDPQLIASETDYGISFCSSIEKDNILACQFHPEKSQRLGLKILENFARW